MSPRRLCALVAGLRSYEDTATYLQDRPGWSREDEWSARIIESLEHWGPLSIIALTGGKGRLPQVNRLFEHKDRPGVTKAPTSDAATIGRFFDKHISGGG